MNIEHNQVHELASIKYGWIIMLRVPLFVLSAKHKI